MPEATLILHRKRIFDDGSISEIKLWQVTTPVGGSSHVFKYSLYYGKPGQRWIGYDNEAGKGDHRHLGAHEAPYRFVSPEQLVTDFLADIRAEQLRREKKDEAK
ncbi:DUF6516 family protein [Phenylobacterium sp.]|uniref:toxin-antitoxin system TumE family protein n=1 Tax=Phenylobacterium sp. TaxID=1871053 RepID=UPI0025E647AD|nr:DUF6516 family protein [Phenylobacterium sp.]